MSPLNFSDPDAVAIINNWINQNTNGKITEIVDRIDPRSTVLILLNAMYFSAEWSWKFDKNSTKDDVFIKSDGSQVPCQMMHKTYRYDYYENDLFQIINLPFINDYFSMIALLPNADKSVKEMITELTPAILLGGIYSLKPQLVYLSLPKFGYDFEIKLNDVLTSLDMGIIISPASADFSGFSPLDMCIDEVKHKTYVSVDEDGIEASAATAVIGIRGLADSVMRIDRPFVFLLIDNISKTILFIGMVENPQGDGM